MSIVSRIPLSKVPVHPEASLASLVNRVSDAFVERYGIPPTIVVAAPGRVNLIGEHIDYNDGFVMPIAIERYVVVAASITPDPASHVAEIQSEDIGQAVNVSLDQTPQPGRQDWGKYVSGVIAGFMKRGVTIPAFQALVGSNLPIGSGLSSSAALEVAVATLLESIGGETLPLSEKALLCQTAEHQFAGVPCGIMDQFSSVFGQLDHLMLIDCCSQHVEQIPFANTSLSLVICNSNVQHELSNGEYADRRAKCDAAIRKIGASNWRDVTMDDIADAKMRLSEDEFRCARHVVSEIRRTTTAAELIVNGNWQAVGELMYQSHQSLRDDFRVSCNELDILVEIAASLASQNGVIGSRMTGGGFGGSTVTLLPTDQVESFIGSLAHDYESRTGITPHCFASRPARGAHLIAGPDDCES